MRAQFTIMTLALVGFSFFAQAQQVWPPELILTPEQSNFVRTSTYDDVMRFINVIKDKSSNIHLISMGKSPEGKDIPVLVLADPLVKTPEQAKASGKPVIYIQGNIHAGEVEGKEVVMMMVRDVLLGDKKDLLQNQIILFAPIYNTDSNDKMEKGRRPSQEDSPLEVGIRENSQGLDLNRDGVKMEAMETQGLFTNIITKWDPQVFADLHTTNGTWHAYPLTWAPSYHYAGEASTYEYNKNSMIKSIVQSMITNYSIYTGPYGDYDLGQGWPPRNFYTYNHHPRYLINQFSLRNRMGILSEAFAHERFYQRIHSTYSFVTEILDYTNKHAAEILSVNQKAEEAAIKNVVEGSGKIKKGVRFKMVPSEKLNGFKTYDYVQTKKPDGSAEYLRTGRVVTYNDVLYHGEFQATVESTLPRGYVFPAELSMVAEHLKKHGVKVEKLSKGQSFSGERFIVDTLQHSKRKFEGHFMATAKGRFTMATKKFKKGDYVVDLAQPLANFIFYLLEPQSDDGLVTWNFFDEYLERQGINNKSVEYPVFKYYKK
ncbi:MAG: M14 family metallopeptidase [Bacteroidota bacterium]